MIIAGAAGAVVIAASLWSSPVAAQQIWTNVERFHRICAGYKVAPKDADLGGPCMFYVAGIVDGFWHAAYLERSICFPKGITNPTIIATIFDSFNADPPPADGNAPTFIFRALMRAYPCRR